MPKVSAREARAAREILEQHEQKTWQRSDNPEHGWIAIPEVPSDAEINPTRERREKLEQERWNDYQKDPIYNPNLATNIVDGPWESKEDYLKAHFQILREDAIASLRTAVAKYRDHPEMSDDRDTRIYTHVFITGLLLSRHGPAVRVEFSTERAGKQIRWEQSSRLTQGTLVALTPTGNNFQNICKLAVVAARPVNGGLDQNPPTIDLFWGSWGSLDEKFNFNPLEEWTMVEAREGYFEASRHMLVGLQKLMTQTFPLGKYIIQLIRKIGAPRYLEENPYMDLTTLELPRKLPRKLPENVQDNLVDATDTTDFSVVNVLDDFPENINSGMDKSQMDACKAMLTRRVAIVQGPPGTGKTFVSVSALRVLIQNLQDDDPPIIVAAQTNHALDQLLNHILRFETKVVRLGGRSDKKNTEIRKRTLYELRMANTNVPDARQGMKQCTMQHQKICDEIKGILGPIIKGDILSAQTLVDYNVITEAQRHSLNHGHIWSDDEEEDEEEAQNHDDIDISDWLGPSQLTSVKRAPAINLGLPLEEMDLEFEQLQKTEDEISAERDDLDIEALRGVWIPFGRKFTALLSERISDYRAQKNIRDTEGLNSVPQNQRGKFYRGFELLLLLEIQGRLKECLSKYKKSVEEYKVTKAMSNFRLIRHLDTRVIGCTTTGLAKYRALLAALQPRALFIEEAAETLEGTITAGIFESLQQLILVGDHKQLQASCNVKALEEAPYHMNISMFERLVNNSVPFVMLKKQRRMVPAIRQLLCIEPDPFYAGLEDHPSVLDRVINRPLVRGMGGKDVYFFHHEWPESMNADSSRFNSDESEMIAGFFHYLVLNGTEPLTITVLTFYNGQRKAILKDLKSHPGLQGIPYFNVFTIDSYQGEENDVILLSLTRSNQQFRVGFLDNMNRVVVALSRARCGLYLFGNSWTLASMETTEDKIGRDALWYPIINFMNQRGQFDVDRGLPVQCLKHNTIVNIMEPRDWNDKAGGCGKMCGGELKCGHSCTLKCHPFEHEHVDCKQACLKVLVCGHGCSNTCGKECRCDRCHVETLLHGVNGASGGLVPRLRSSDAVPDVSSVETSTRKPKPRVGTFRGFWGSEGRAGSSRDDGSKILGPNRPPPAAPMAPRAMREATAGRGTSFQHRGCSGSQCGNRSQQPVMGSTSGSLHAKAYQAVPLASGPKQPTSRSTSGQLHTTAYHPVNRHASGPQMPLYQAFGEGSVISTADTWRQWNAREADQKLAESNRLADQNTPKIDTVIMETYYEVAFTENGERKKGREKETLNPFLDGTNEYEEPVVASSSQKPATKNGLSEKPENPQALPPESPWQQFDLASDGRKKHNPYQGGAEKPGSNIRPTDLGMLAVVTPRLWQPAQPVSNQEQAARGLWTGSYDLFLSAAAESGATAPGQRGNSSVSKHRRGRHAPVGIETPKHESTVQEHEAAQKEDMISFE